MQTHRGIKGLIRNDRGEMISNATIKVYRFHHYLWQYIDHDIRSSTKEILSCRDENSQLFIDFGGDYYRLLRDGLYAIAVESPGYERQIRYIKVDNQVNENHAQRLDFILRLH